MNKAFVASLLLLTMLTISGCKTGTSNESQTLEPTITHKYEVTSSSSIELSIIAVPESGHQLSINGREVPMGLHTFSHSGSASYNISSKTRFLTSSLAFSTIEATEITYKWTEYKNGKEAKTETQKLSLQPNDYENSEDYQTDLLEK